MTNATCKELSELSRAIQRANFIRNTAYVNAVFACKWAVNNASGPFVAFVPEDETVEPIQFVAILVQPANDERTPRHWHYTAHVCPFHGSGVSTNDPSKARYQDALAGYSPEVVINDTRHV